MGLLFLTTPHFVFNMGRLAQQFVNVAGALIKSQSVDKLAEHQELAMRNHAALSADHIEWLRNQIYREYPDAELGRYVYHPANIPGSRRYYQKQYTNLHALKAEMGHNPEFF